MGKGPALALLLAGPARSLPNMLVIRSIMGTQKTVVFVALVMIMATASGMIYGHFRGQGRAQCHSKERGSISILFPCDALVDQRG